MLCPSLSTHAVGGIFNKYSCAGTGQVWLISFPDTGSRGGAPCLSDTKGKEHGTGNYRDDGTEA